MVDLFVRVRELSVALCAPLEIEDYGVQPMADASPPKWHLAHTTWFFETFILKEFVPGYQPVHEQYEYLFNSYYNGVGTPFPRVSRGFLSRPTVAQVLDYRVQIDEAMHELLEGCDNEEIWRRLVLGCHHEQQHQELLITDLKYNFGHNPLYPAYVSAPVLPAARTPADMRFVEQSGGITYVGVNATSDSFFFDNEGPDHQVLLQPYAVGDRLVTNGEYLEFINDGGYANPQIWLAEGWAHQLQQGWQCPEYWVQRDGQWFEYRLDGLHPLRLDLPVVHVSGHEAFAYANWAGARLMTEFEFEASVPLQTEGGYLEQGFFHPMACPEASAGSGGWIKQGFGQTWQWTASAYGPYPGYEPMAGTLGEYNGKFMSSQLVLRGASCVTPQTHARRTYRNFFYPPDRWQFTGIRLAKNV
ncbi:MAG: ergothioneine biosynthesis protein EgtB [Pseudomonadota bacterium]